jgi:hypothetical protein
MSVTGVDRKSSADDQSDANDPQRTCGFLLRGVVRVWHLASHEQSCWPTRFLLVALRLGAARPHHEINRSRRRSAGAVHVYRQSVVTAASNPEKLPCRSTITRGLSF